MTLFFHLLACGAAVAFLHPAPPLVTGPTRRIVGRTDVGRKQLPAPQRLGHLRMLGPDVDPDSIMPDFRNAEYRREMRKRRAPQQPAAQPTPPPIIDLASAWVLIFNSGQRNEGVYTLQAMASSSVLAFESTDDANRFADLLINKGFDRATPVCWDTDKLTSYCHAADFKVELVPRGNVPTPPPKNEYDPGTQAAPERAYAGGDSGRLDPYTGYRYPGGGSRRLDPYTSYRLRLEALFPQKPDDCADDDCTLPGLPDEGLAVRMPVEGQLRDEAKALIDAILETLESDLPDMDLTTLMKNAWEKAETDTEARDEAQRANQEEDA